MLIQLRNSEDTLIVYTVDIYSYANLLLPLWFASEYISTVYTIASIIMFRNCQYINVLRKGDSNLDEKQHRNKTAVAITYNPDDVAPKVIASGKGYLADRIIERAKEADIPLHKDEGLANTLSKLELGDLIPPELYEVVAEVLVFVDKMDRIKGKVDYTDE